MTVRIKQLMEFRRTAETLHHATSDPGKLGTCEFEHQVMDKLQGIMADLEARDIYVSLVPTLNAEPPFFRSRRRPRGLFRRTSCLEEASSGGSWDSRTG